MKQKKAKQAAKLKAERERERQRKELWEKEKKQRKEKKRLYREKKLAKADLENAQQQQELQEHRCLLAKRYLQKVAAEQDCRRLSLKELSQPHVLSPCRKREEKIRRREQQDETHAVWRAQKRKQRRSRK